MKKKARNGAVLKRHHLLLPLDARNRGRRRFFFLPLSPPSNLQKDVDLPTTFHVLDGRWRGGSTVAAPSTSPSPVFAYKNRGRGRKKETENKREEKNRERERDQGREKRREKDERKRKEKERKKKTAKEEENTEEGGETAGPRASAASVAATPGKPSAFLFCLHFFPHHSRRAQCTSAGGEKLVMHSNQLMWGGPSPAYVVGPGSA
jgi:hypothetical protein